MTTITSSNMNQEKSNILERHKSQLFQQVSKIGVKRSHTTKPSTSPQTYQPILFSSISSSLTKKKKPQKVFVTDATNQTLLLDKPDRGTLKATPLYDMQANRQYIRHYPALFSSVAYEMKKRIVLSDRIKNNILYSNVFDGKQAVDALKDIISVTDRGIALTVGRALESQRFFHDVDYENRLIDNITEIYQFNDVLFNNLNSPCLMASSNGPFDQSVTSAVLNDYTVDDENDEEDDSYSLNTDTTIASAILSQNNASLPTGVYTELTRCYSPTCNYRAPCYSYTCPKRVKMRHRLPSVDTCEKRITAYAYELQKEQQLWSHTVEEHILILTPILERKRQETIFELIYTEIDFLRDLDYIIKMWIEPLMHNDIIPSSRRHDFIKKVFSNITEIRSISNMLALSLKERQSNHPIFSHVSDIMESFIKNLSPFIHYGSGQYQAKYIYERERYNNPKFAAFAEEVERDPVSKKLELNGYLTKPTCRLGKYPILLERIHANTLPNHPDKEKIPYIINSIKHILHQVNYATGTAKNRFELDQIHRNLSFKNTKDVMDLRLLDPERRIIKQAVLRKTANLDSAEIQAILFDHYLVLAKKKIIHAVDHYIIQKRPIPIELLSVMIPLSNTLPSASPTNRTSSNTQMWVNNQVKVGVPIHFLHQGRKGEDFYTLYAPDEINRKAWDDTIQAQKEIKFKKRPIFGIVDSAKRYEFFADIKAHHMIVFDEGRYYLLATDSGLYMGPNYGRGNGVPHKILPLENVRQVHVLEEYQLLLVLADDTLWQYPLDITINGRSDGLHSIVHFGRKVRTNVPFFHVGICLEKAIICVPKPSPIIGTDIDIFEATMPKTEQKKKSLFSKMSLRSLSLKNTQVVPLKPIYNPFDVWSIDNTPTLLILTTQSGISAVEMTTKTVHQLLDPDDKALNFITKHEKVDDLSPAKKLSSLFQAPNGNYLVCYDKYAFYIDKKGRRTEHHFKIEWEGTPTAFSYYHPYIIAFEHQFIEIRNVFDGHLEQIIQEKDIYCLQNGHKEARPTILGTMTDRTNSLYQHIFELKLIQNQQYV